ncbi:hypothetical protein [Botrimarina colliarenosi]|uniref:hypothetical protein n=1 Tax=Botrimarina colliarenosi TaxID=2528001 RepID=UPI0011B6AB83|nr:hypothetical protein [Botrimarina colliarenosi]
MACSAAAQSPLDADLDRAAAGFERAATEAPDEVETLAAAAGAHYQDGHVDEAVAALDRAAALAFRAGATGRSFELSLTAAEALRSQGRLADAAERFQQAALRNPRDPRAAAAHATAIEALGATLDPARPDQLAAYAKLLEQHLATWSDAPTAQAARWGRVELLARRRQWEPLLDALAQIDAGDPHYERSRELLVAAHAGCLAEEPSKERLMTAWNDLQPLIFVNPTKWPDAWTPLQREAALTLARGALESDADGLENARRLLRQALAARPLPDPAWERRAAVTLVVSSLAAGDSGEAAKAIESAYPGPADERRQLLETTHRRLLARAGSLLDEADRLERSVVALEGGEGDGVGAAAALADAGRDADARRLYERLAAERPDDRGVQVAYARLLAQSKDAAERAAALARWRAIESRSNAGSDDWFEARLARVRLMTELGQHGDARKLLAITRLLEPTLGGDKRRAEFDELSKMLGEASR